MIVRQTERPSPIPLAFVVKKGSKICSTSFPRNAATTVGNGHNHCVTIVLDSSTNAQLALQSVAIRHCVTSIDYQVDQDLLKLHRVAGNRRQILAPVQYPH